MEHKFFSESLEDFTGQIENPQLADSLSLLASYFGTGQLRILKWDDYSIAIPVLIKVEVPPLGTYKNIDIRKEEPILIVFSLKNYPSVSPVVYPDRLDFPKDTIGHLYVAKNGKPPGICLVRGEMSVWYSNKRVTDIIIRTANWFQDASTGKLNFDGQQFEPLRLEGYSGNIIYDYDLFNEIVNKNTSDWGNFAWCLFERMTELDSLSLRLYKVLDKSNLDAAIKEVKEEREKDTKLSTTKIFYFGFLFWSSDEKAYENYDVHLPTDWESFKIYAKKYGIEIKELEKSIIEFDLNHYILFPVIIAIKRPLDLIGFNGQFEFVNFLFRLDSTDVSEGKIINNIPIKFQKHLQPLTRKKARVISGIEELTNDKLKFVFGCGALGSKIITHLARNGISKFVLSDPANLSPHNLVRHTLFSEHEGKNKAIALENTLNQIFLSDNDKIISHSSPTLILNMLPDWPYPGWLFDFTASDALQNQLLKLNFKNEFLFIRSYISDRGNLGLLYIEGKDRNPRSDDLQNLLYSTGMKDPKVAEWLKRESELANDPDVIQIGIGCNSETTILPDEVVSIHAAYFAGVIKEQLRIGSIKDGRIFLSHIDKENLQISSNHLTITPFNLFLASNDSTWEIRMAPNVIERMKKLMEKADPFETGGVFIGSCNYKTKSLHVVDMIEAPPDSKANSVCFFRGISGLKDAIAVINESTGHQLGYIGEWHSHPHGPEGLSDTDMNTIRDFKSEFASLTTPLPVFLAIITKKSILPFIF
jgi:hypothetical protein